MASIRYLRGLAALAVAAFHACQWSGVDFDVGAGGVDVFFVISGVVIWIVTRTRRQRAAAFLTRRLVRIGPLYWIITLGVAAAALAAPGRFPAIQLDGRSLLLSLAFIPHADPAGRVFPTLPPGWSLNYEAAFYLIVASGLSAAPRQRLMITMVRLSALALFGFLYHPAYELLANPTMLEFAAGCLVGEAYLNGRLPGRRAGLALIAAGLAAFAAQKLAGFHSDLWRPLAWGVPAALIVGGAVCVEASGGVPNCRALAMLGDGSYSLYLCHWPVIVLLAAALGQTHSWLFASSALLASVAIGLACRQLVEKPLLAVLGRRRSPIWAAAADFSG